MDSTAETQQKRWEVAPLIPDHIARPLNHLNPVLRQVLYNRGLTHPAEIQAFLEGHYLPTTDPFVMADMQPAVDRILHAIDQREIIYVYGDFDCDGVTSTILLTEAIRCLGYESPQEARRHVRPYIPHRVDEGYGLNFEALTLLRTEKKAGLVITVDCGIRAVAEVRHAQEIGLDMIVTDHHSIGATLPPALAVINPKRPDCSYPETMLAGVGIAYKLAVALHQTRPNGFDVRSLLDLVAIGTVADIAPLLGENRILVRDGLVELNKLKRPGLAALADVAKLQKGKMTAESIGFGIGPRINAAGRIGPQTVNIQFNGQARSRPGHAYIAAYLLRATDLFEARHWADILDRTNRERQSLTNSLNAVAAATIKNPEEQHLLFAADEAFKPGVVGLVAGRLKETYYRPAVVLEKGEEESHGSCRSIPEFHITEALDQVADLLVRYGGHAQAAGLTIRNENIPALQKRLTQLAETQLANVDLRPSLAIDMELDLAEIDFAFHEMLQGLEPTGCANTPPVFISRGVTAVFARQVGRDSSHLQLEFDIGDGLRTHQAIGFGMGEWFSKLESGTTKVDIVYSVGINEWRGNKRLQLMLQDMRLA